MRPISVEVTIKRPAEEVYAFLEDVENNPRWLRGMRSCAWTSPPPVHVGSTYEQHAHFLGKEIRTAFEVTEVDPPRTITIRSVRSPFPLTVTRSVAARDGASARVREVVHSDPAGYYKLATPILAWLVRRNIHRDYRRLKALLERQTAAG